jgi:hypothetical protein
MMDTADKLGVLMYWRWLIGHNVLVTLLLCWTVTPGVMMLVAPILESRWLPLSPERQFLSFFPGDLFLGAGLTGLLLLAQRLPVGERWYQATWWHLLVQATTLVVALGITYAESGTYPLRALLSPTKLYHNIVLYAVYGYLIVTTLVAVLAGSRWSVSFAVALAFVLAPVVLVWAPLVARDSTLRPDVGSAKAASAHVADWRPVWRRE